MKKSRYTEIEIVKILKEQEKGLKVLEIARKYGIGEQTFYSWKQKYGGMDKSQLLRLKEVEDENRRLKRMFADLSLENAALKDVIEKKL